MSFLNSDSIRGLEERLSTDMKLYETFQVLRMGYYPETMSFEHLNNVTSYVPDNSKFYVCSMKHYETEAYNSCVSGSQIQ